MKKYPLEFWEKHVLDYEAMDRRGRCSIVEFCSGRGLNRWTFKTKRTYLRKAWRGGKPGMLPVRVQSAAAVSAKPDAQVARPCIIEAEIPGRVLLRFQSGTDVRYLSELCAAIGGQS